MEPSILRSAVAAAISTATALGLRADGAVVLHNSNRIAVRLLPCDVLARVSPASYRHRDEFELEMAGLLAGTGSPVAPVDPRVAPTVYEHDGFAIAFWVYYDQLPPRAFGAAEYAGALERLHAGMREVADPPIPHFTSRVEDALRIIDDRDRSPELPAADRTLLRETLVDVTRGIRRRGNAEQMLHGEPHPGNLMRTRDGLLFLDLETCCRGPVEFDVIYAPEEVAEHYPGLDPDQLRDCRTLSLALVTCWRWDRDDEFPGGRQMGIDCLRQLRMALNR